MSGKVVEGEVVDGAPRPRRNRGFFHPLSGAAILAVDWLAFGLELFSGFAAVSVVCVAAFAVTFYVVLRVQRRLHGDRPGPALAKALLGALAAGLPVPIAGTMLGAAILALSTPPSWPRRW